MDKRDTARRAKEYLKSAKDNCNCAKELLKKIGDRDGEKLADDAQKSAEAGEKHIEKRLEH